MTHNLLDPPELCHQHHYLESIQKAHGPACLSYANPMARWNQVSINHALNKHQPWCLGPEGYKLSKSSLSLPANSILMLWITPPHPPTPSPSSFASVLLLRVI